MDTAALHSFLQRNRYGIVSSVSHSGTPQSALVGIATTPKLEIIFDTIKSSRKYSNLTARPLCSFVVGWENEQTVQFEGVATQPEGSELEDYLNTYFAVWPECRAHSNWQGITYFVVKPRWIRYSDYGQTPALIIEIEKDLPNC